MLSGEVVETRGSTMSLQQDWNEVKKECKSDKTELCEPLGPPGLAFSEADLHACGRGSGGSAGQLLGSTNDRLKRGGYHGASRQQSGSAQHLPILWLAQP